MNKSFIKIYNRFIQDRKRHPEQYRNVNIKKLALDEYNGILKEEDEKQTKTVDEQKRIKLELEEERRRQNALQFGLEDKYLPNGMTPNTYMIDGFTVIDYSNLKKRKAESNIWNF